MALPVEPNEIIDIYRLGNAPPNPADIKAVPCFLTSQWVAAQSSFGRENNSLPWTHEVLVDASTDIRDAYAGQYTVSAQDTVYLGGRTATAFKVVFVELMQRGTPNAYLRVFLDRQTPSWPTTEL